MRSESKRKPRALNPINPVNAVMLVFSVIATLEPLARRLGHDHPEVRKAADALAKNLERQYNRKLQAQALRLRRRSRKSDVKRLWRLPGEKSPRIFQLIERLELATRLGGRGVIPEPRTFYKALADALAVYPRIGAAKPNERRKLRKVSMPKYADLLEAAFRESLQKRLWETCDKRAPHTKASEIAEERVADAAGITRSVVHQLCQKSRDEFKAALAAVRPGRGVAREPAITAVELKDFSIEWSELTKLTRKK